MLSMNDVILRLGRPTRHLALTRHVLTALHRICEHLYQGGEPTASEALANLGRYRQTEEAVSRAALLEEGTERKKKKKRRRKPARTRSPQS